MIQIHPVRPEELDAVKGLWHTVFGDSPEIIDAFYRTSGVRGEDTLALWEDGALRSMLYLLPTEVRWSGGSARGGYVFALATHPEARGRGFARMLLSYVDFYAGEIGLDCATVVPAEPGLHAFFSAAGFSEGFSTRVAELTAADLPESAPGDAVDTVGAEEYLKLREELLSGRSYAACPAGQVAFQRVVSHMSGGGLFRLELGDRSGLAAVECWDGTVVVKELLAHDPLRALSLAAAMVGGERFQLRTPAWSDAPGALRKFGMIKWYRPEPAAKWASHAPGYLGLAFD